VVLSAGIQDRTGARALILRLASVAHELKVLFADGAYTGKLIDWAWKMFQWPLSIVTRHTQGQFEPLPWRWIVERTFAWLGNARRLSKDYELLPGTSESFIQITMISLMLRRLEKA